LLPLLRTSSLSDSVLSADAHLPSESIVSNFEIRIWDSNCRFNDCERFREFQGSTHRSGSLVLEKSERSNLRCISRECQSDLQKNVADRFANSLSCKPWNKNYLEWDCGRLTSNSPHCRLMPLSSSLFAIRPLRTRATAASCKALGLYRENDL